MSLESEQTPAENEKLGMVLSAFRGVTEGIHLDVLSITLAMRTPGSAAQCSVNSAIVHPTPAHAARNRRQHKITALLQTLADRLYNIGYVLTDIELKDKEIPPSATQQGNAANPQFPLQDEWQMSVNFVQV